MTPAELAVRVRRLDEWIRDHAADEGHPGDAEALADWREIRETLGALVIDHGLPQPKETP